MVSKQWHREETDKIGEAVMYEKCHFKDNLEVLCRMPLKGRKTSEETSKKSAARFSF